MPEPGSHAYDIQRTRLRAQLDEHALATRTITGVYG
jgi:hypothetical protein